MSEEEHGPGFQGDGPARQGAWAVKVSFLALLFTAAVEGGVVAFSGSAALLAGTVHNLGNAASDIPLWIAFRFSQRPETRNFPYGYYRTEDAAGVLILLLIAVSAVVAGYGSVASLLSGEEPRSLVADGYHARTDGFASLAVIAGLLGVALGAPILDPLVGLLITGLIVYVLLREAGPPVMQRLLDRMDDEVMEQLQTTASQVSDVRRVADVRARWVGHRLLAELTIGVAGDLSVREGHRLAENTQHALLHQVPRLYRCIVHVEPEVVEEESEQAAAHHFPQEQGPEGPELS
jgi:divalent metal cation (Fe/Co/Zn/Cd) transporter